MTDEAERRTGDAVRRRPDDGAEISGEGEQWPGHCLRRAVAGEKRIVAHPAGRDKRLAQQRQHNVTASEYEGARAVERVKQRHTGAGTRALQNRQATEQHRNRVSATNPARRETGMTIWPSAGARRAAAQPQPEQARRQIDPICASDELLNRMRSAPSKPDRRALAVRA